jgi:hypothetical protein
VAVVVLNFVKKGRQERRTAKANIKYIQHRRGRDKALMNRTLFTANGEITRQQAYALVNEADSGSTFFRIKISPDPAKEDNPRDLLLREITRETMASAAQTGHPVSWVAAIHSDHTDKRHVHVLAVTTARRLPAPSMIQAATKACKDQRLALDREREQDRQREQEGDEWERER